MKKRIFPLLLLVSPYLYLLIPIIALMNHYEFSDFEQTLSLCLLGAVFVANMVYAFVAAKWKSSRELLFWDMLIKLCNIPLYICNFFGGLFALVLPIGFLVTIFMVVIDYLLLLPSTMYGVSGLEKAWKEGKIPKNIAVICGILHFFFCTDVVCAVVMYCMVRSQDKKEAPTA